MQLTARVREARSPFRDVQTGELLYTHLDCPIQRPFFFFVSHDTFFSYRQLTFELQLSRGS
jgi:hypothetical protein